MTTTTTPVHELLAEYARHTVLDEGVQAQLAKAHNDTIALIVTGEISSINQLNIAPSETCEEADLPHGSTWTEVVASVLDAQQGTSNHLRELARTAEEAVIELAAAKGVW